MSGRFDAGYLGNPELDVEKVQSKPKAYGDTGLSAPPNAAGKMRHSMSYGGQTQVLTRFSTPLIAVNYEYNKRKGEEFILHDDHLDRSASTL